MILTFSIHLHSCVRILLWVWEPDKLFPGDESRFFIQPKPFFFKYQYLPAEMY